MKLVKIENLAPILHEKLIKKLTDDAARYGNADNEDFKKALAEITVKNVEKILTSGYLNIATKMSTDCKIVTGKCLLQEYYYDPYIENIDDKLKPKEEISLKESTNDVYKKGLKLNGSSL